MFNKLKSLYYQYQELIAYAFWGVATTVINVVVFWLLHNFTSWNYIINATIAWILSVLFSYLTNKAYVFHSPSESLMSDFLEMISFFGGRLATLFLEFLMLWIGITLMHQNQILVKIVENVIVIAINYFWSKWLVFRNSQNQKSTSEKE
ncbi:cell wall teichoic acid glycosylation protein GtcA [Lentilactobacillus fungorum]|uniref:Cell wall teichoic acid glycosylation protein GtcA n=1 Tax=Lentilactobacillus fungorum TaxID=2201250 RepID=A0ABQ3W0N7_9LACO|nr:GtrA family protein [Lentilactobacillus fungorum]GHP14735.1 cell wall teichoic acid glycosylation protein GtcA [Lentilactobacillus fungorum]